MMTFRSDPKIKGLLGAVLLLIAPAAMQSAIAGEADVVAAEIRTSGNNTFTVFATILHDDTGWDHYADAFEVLAPDGKVLATRVLLHPHENEQPFTRSVSGVEIPADIEVVTIRAHDKVHGSGGKEVELRVER